MVPPLESMLFANPSKNLSLRNKEAIILLKRLSNLCNFITSFIKIKEFFLLGAGVPEGPLLHPDIEGPEDLPHLHAGQCWWPGRLVLLLDQFSHQLKNVHKKPFVTGYYSWPHPL